MHIFKSIQLCNLLDIKPYIWLPSLTRGNAVSPLEKKIFSSAPFLNNLIIPKFEFNMLFGMVEYFYKKYGAENVRCDNRHLADEYQEILVRDYLLPFIEDRYVL